MRKRTAYTTEVAAAITATTTTTRRNNVTIAGSCFTSTGGITVYNGGSIDEPANTSASKPAANESTNSDESTTNELRGNSCDEYR
jgi:hypothetical protein